MTTEDDLDLEALFAQQDDVLPAEPFTAAVMSRVRYSGMVRKLVLGVGSVAGAVAAVAILPSGLIGAAEKIGQFEIPKLSLQSLPDTMDNPYWIVGAAVLAGGIALLTSWSIEKT